jgi:hypothetical protein
MCGFFVMCVSDVTRPPRDLVQVLPKIIDKELRDDRNTQYRPARLDG